MSIKAVENQRKRPLSGKRKVVDGKHVMTAAELLGVEEAEKATKERKAKKGTGVPRKRGRKAKEESSDESEIEFELSDDESIELLDCIEVEM